MKKMQLPSKRRFILIVVFFLLVTFSTTVVMAQQNRVRVEANVLNVRVGPGLSYSVMEQVVAGEELNVIEEENEWYKVRLSDDNVGWVASWHVDHTDPAAYSDTYTEVAVPQANIRQHGSEDAEILGQVYEGTELSVLYQENNWTQVQYMGGLGWIRNDLLKTPEQSNTAEVAEIKDRKPIHEATIVLDAGHGGVDPGAVTSEFYEKDITLETTLRLYNRLQDTGANVILTRSDDTSVSLDDRAYASNKNFADAFISIHYDSTAQPNSKSGTTTYYYDDKDLPMAETVNAHLEKNGILPNNGIGFGNYLVLRENTQPSILLELGYLNNTHDLSVVYTDHYQNVIVEVLYHALVDYFE